MNWRVLCLVGLFSLVGHLAYAYQVGGVFEATTGDAIDGNNPYRYRIYGLSDKLPLFGLPGNAYGDLILESGKSGIAASIGYQWPLFIYGPSRYVWRGGADFYSADSTSLKSAIAAFFGIEYEEELTSGFYLNGGAFLRGPAQFRSNSVAVLLTFGIKYYFDTAKDSDGASRLTSIDYNAILNKYTVTDKSEIKDDMSAKIGSFDASSGASGIVVPKFTYRGKAFVLSKSVSADSNYKNISVKIDGISLKQNTLTKVSDTKWEIKILIPARYSDPQLNITVVSKTADGRSITEYVSTLVE